jgi:hypothetical protein
MRIIRELRDPRRRNDEESLTPVIFFAPRPRAVRLAPALALSGDLAKVKYVDMRFAKISRREKNRRTGCLTFSSRFAKYALLRLIDLAG